MNDLISGLLIQSLIFSIMVMGVYITYKILDFPDLSADGTFTLGASITANTLAMGINPIITVLLSFVGGFIAGSVTGFLNVKLKITNLLSGILVMVSLYSINLRIMGRANIALFNYDNLFEQNPLFISIMLTLIIAIFFTLFFKTKLGYLIKACGNNETMVSSLSRNPNQIKVLALCISNGLIALSGSLMAYYQGFSDINMGTGIIVIGLASIIMGLSLKQKIKSLNIALLCFIGSFLYRGSLLIALRAGFNPSDLKLISCIIVVIALSSPNFKFKKKNSLNKKLKTSPSLIKNTKEVA